MTEHEGRTILGAPMVLSGASNGSTYYRSNVGGISVEYRYEPQCTVCTADYELLAEVHALAVQRTPVARIHRMVSDRAGFSEAALRRHLRNHMSGFDGFDTALRSAAAAFSEINTPERVTARHAAQTVMELGYAAIVDGHAEIKVTDVLAAARLSHELEMAAQDGGDAVFMSEAMSLILTEARKALGGQRFNEMMYSLRSNPRMVRLVRSAAGSIDDEPIEAQVIEDVPQIESAKPLSTMELLQIL